MSLSIVPHPHPTLRHKSKPVVRVDRELKSMVAEMFDLMYANHGVGLAANQVALPIRLFVVNPSGARGEGEELALLNPEIQRPKGNEADREGCLSLPEIYGQVKRPKAIRLTAYDISGNLIQRDFDGFFARVLQHELDHLNGVMFFDRMPEEAVREIEYEIDELETDFRSKQETGEIPSDEKLREELQKWEKRYC